MNKKKTVKFHQKQWSPKSLEKKSDTLKKALEFSKAPLMPLRVHLFSQGHLHCLAGNKKTVI